MVRTAKKKPKTPAKAKRTYRAGKGARYTHKQAQAIGDRIDKIARAGTCTPRMVLDDAQSTRSPLHRHFEWDDGVAAEQYRMEQARHLINHLVIVIENGDVTETKAYHSIVVEEVDEDDRSYMSVDKIRTEQVYVDKVIENAKREVRSWKRRYKEYADVFGKVFVAIENL
jgi:hypothetical protein